MSIEDAWKQLIKMGNGTAKKNSVFWPFLLGKPDEWVGHLTTYAGEFERKTTTTKEKQEMTKGELMQAVGEEEALRKLRGNKYDEVWDSDEGEMLYVKKTKKISQTDSHSSKTTLTRHAGDR